VQGFGDAAVDPFVVPADVEDRPRSAVVMAMGGLPAGGQVGEGGDRVAARLVVAGERGDGLGRGAGRPFDADADQLPLGVSDLLGGAGEQGERGAPGDEPAEVGGELGPEGDGDRAVQVAGGEGTALAQVDDPSPSAMRLRISPASTG
jgi:hypothetical protein